jgi:hypothetical protein
MDRLEGKWKVEIEEAKVCQVSYRREDRGEIERRLREDRGKIQGRPKEDRGEITEGN